MQLGAPPATPLSVRTFGVASVLSDRFYNRVNEALAPPQKRHPQTIAQPLETAKPIPSIADTWSLQDSKYPLEEVVGSELTAASPYVFRQR